MVLYSIQQKWNQYVRVAPGLAAEQTLVYLQLHLTLRRLIVMGEQKALQIGIHFTLLRFRSVTFTKSQHFQCSELKLQLHQEGSVAMTSTLQITGQKSVHQVTPSILSLLTLSVQLIFSLHVSPVVPPLDTEPLPRSAVKIDGAQRKRGETNRCYCHRYLEFHLSHSLRVTAVSKQVRNQSIKMQAWACSDQIFTLCELLLAPHPGPLSIFQYSVFTNTLHTAITT